MGIQPQPSTSKPEESRAPYIKQEPDFDYTFSPISSSQKPLIPLPQEFKREDTDTLLRDMFTPHNFEDEGLAVIKPEYGNDSVDLSAPTWDFSVIPIVYVNGQEYLDVDNLGPYYEPYIKPENDEFDYPLPTHCVFARPMVSRSDPLPGPAEQQSEHVEPELYDEGYDGMDMEADSAKETAKQFVLDPRLA